MATVTAIIPCFNASATLERALASVAAQTRPPAETLLSMTGTRATKPAASQRSPGGFRRCAPGW